LLKGLSLGCRVAIRGHGNAFQAMPRFSGRKSDQWLSADGIDGVGTSYSSFVPRPPQCEKHMFYNYLSKGLGWFGLAPPARKICTRSIVVRRTIIEHDRSKSVHQQHKMRARSKPRSNVAQDLHMLPKFAAALCKQLQLR
jgi:hypothetical protein